jgi:hypothetical protein
MHKLIGMTAWFITAVASILIGLMAVSIDIFAWPVLNNPNVVMVLEYIVGISGLISLIMMIMTCHKGTCACSCGSRKQVM